MFFTVFVLQLEGRRVECKWLPNVPPEVSHSTERIDWIFWSSVLHHQSPLLCRALFYMAINTCFAPSYLAQNIQNNVLCNTIYSFKPTMVRRILNPAAWGARGTVDRCPSNISVVALFSDSASQEHGWHPVASQFTPCSVLKGCIGKARTLATKKVPHAAGAQRWGSDG